MGCSSSPDGARPSTVLTDFAIHGDGQCQARTDGSVVHYDRAGPAVTCTAAELGARKVKVVTKHFIQSPLGIHRHRILVSIHLEFDLVFHFLSPLRLSPRFANLVDL